MGTDCLKHQELATARARNWSKIELWLDLMWLHKISSESTHQVTDGSADKQDDVKVLGKVPAGRRFAWKELLDLEIERDLIEEREVFKLSSPPPNIWSATLQHQGTVSDFCCNQYTVATRNTEIVGQSIFNQLYASYCSIFNISLVLPSLWTYQIMAFYSSFQSSLKLIRNENVDLW